MITVPAAFGSLQCDATGRAARLAGLVEAPLLQEPIAAAIAYGASPGSRDQRWMVFDLGGGTLDIAVRLNAQRPPGGTGAPGEQPFGR